MNFTNTTNRIRPLWVALIVSVILHGLFLSYRWFDVNDQDRRLNTPLSVVLVNASSKAPPQKPQKLAQADLDGGGLTINQDATAMHRARLGADAKLESLERRQKQLLSSLETEKKQASGKRSGEELRQIAEINALEAELSRRLSPEGRLPRRAVLSASSTKTVAFAYYYDAMRQKIEAYGNTFFPRVQGRPLYGSLVLTVSVDAEGRIASNSKGREGIELSRSSGIPELDRQAIAIVRAAAPYGPFPPEMRRQLDILDWVSTFEFTRDTKERSGNRFELKNGANQ
ncbi:TonB/TolA, C-terminal [Burkholderiaceae bacterium]|jgi:protein TonB